MVKSNIYLKLEKFFDETMINIAKKIGYSEENIIILEDNERKLRESYPEVYNNLLSCKHNRDNRTPIEYAQDLVCSWIFEDYLILNLKLLGLNIELSGNDQNRKILKSSSVSSNSDYLVSYNGKKAFVELANDYTGYWKKKNVCDLRDDKYNHIKIQKKDNNFSLLLGIDFVNNDFFIIDIENSNSLITYSEYHFAYHKPVYSINLNKITYKNFSFENIAKSLKSILGQ